MELCVKTGLLGVGIHDCQLVFLLGFGLGSCGEIEGIIMIVRYLAQCKLFLSLPNFFNLRSRLIELASDSWKKDQKQGWRLSIL
jgi:hypothetical protein